MRSRRSEPLFALARLSPIAAILLVTVPVLTGLAGTVLPAFGYLPALGAETFSLDAFRRLFAEPGIAMAIVLSAWTGLAASLLSILLASLILAAGFGTRGWDLLSRLLSPILSVPHAATAIGLAFLLAPSGFISRLVSPWATGWQTPPDFILPNDAWGLALIAGLVIKEVPFLLLMLMAALAQADAARTMQMAGALGYGRLASFYLALWPRLYGQVRIAVFAVLAFSASVVDVSLILGPANPGTLVTMLLRFMNDPDLTMRLLASAGALVQLSVVLALFAVWLAIEALGRFALGTFALSGRRFRHDGCAVLAGRFAGWLVAIIVLCGIMLLGIWSLSGLWPYPDVLPHTVTAANWMKILPSIGAPLVTTLEVGFLSALFATMLTILLQANRQIAGSMQTLLAISLSLPLVVPQIAFLFGLQIAALRAGIGYGAGALVLAHFLFVMPYVHLSLAEPWASLDPRYEQMALALGKTRTRALLMIRLPLLIRPILTAFAIGFAVSVGLYLPTVLIGAGRLPTITTEAVALASGSNRRIIGVYAFLQSLLPFLGFVLAFAIPAWLFRNRAAMRVT